MCYSFVFIDFNTVRVWDILVSILKGIKRWQINATLTKKITPFLHMNWGGQLTRNLRPFYLPSLGCIHPASLFSCILTQFILRSPGAFQAKACYLHLDTLTSDGKPGGSPKAKRGSTAGWKK